MTSSLPEFRDRSPWWGGDLQTLRNQIVPPPASLGGDEKELAFETSDETGDVLTGLVSGLVSQGHAPAVAACLGTFLHGLAGDLAAEEVGEIGLSAGDLLHRLPDAWQQLRS